MLTGVVYCVCILLFVVATMMFSMMLHYDVQYSHSLYFYICPHYELLISNITLSLHSNSIHRHFNSWWNPKYIYQLNLILSHMRMLSPTIVLFHQMYNNCFLDIIKRGVIVTSLLSLWFTLLFANKISR